MSETYPVPYDPNATDSDEPLGSRLKETSGPTTLRVGEVADGQFLKRVGDQIEGAASGGGGITNSAPTGTIPVTTDGDGNLAASQLTDDGRALAGAAAVGATVNLTLAEQPTVGDTMTIGRRSYDFVAEATPSAFGEIPLGGSLEATQASVLSVINEASGFANPDVLASAFTDNVSTLTARAIGTAGNGIAVEGTFTSGSNLFSAAQTSGGVDEVGYLEVGPGGAPQGAVRLSYQQSLTAADQSGNTRKLIQLLSTGFDDVVVISSPHMPDDQEPLFQLRSSDGAVVVLHISSDGDSDFYLNEINGAQFRWSSVDDGFVSHQLLSIDPNAFKISKYGGGGSAFEVGTDGSYAGLGVIQVFINATVTPAATTGAQTINKSAGSVNFAASATSLVVTNSSVTANSIIIATVATNDATMKSVAVVAGSGSFTLHANAAATGETRVNWWVITPQ